MATSAKVFLILIMHGLEPTPRSADPPRMRVEGTQNMSRIPGVYVYPVRRYHTEPVENVPRVERKPPQADARQLKEDNLLELYTTKGIDRSTRIIRPASVDVLA